MAYGQRGMYPPMQGGGFYNPFMKKPHYGAGIQQTVQQVMAQKEMRKQQEQREKLLKQQKEQQSFENRMRMLKFLKGMEPSVRMKALDRLVEQKIISPQQKDMTLAGITKIETHQEKIDKITAEVTAREETKAKFRPEPKPTQFEMKRTALSARLKAGTITQEQHDEALYNIKPKPSQEEIIRKGANPRQSNDTWLKDVYNKVDSKAVKKEAKKAKARPVVRGIALDMPYKYNLAILNRNDGVETPEDLDIIQKYDAMFQYFNDTLRVKAEKFKDFMKLPEAKDPDFDKAQIKIWYDIYRKY